MWKPAKHLEWISSKCFQKHDRTQEVCVGSTLVWIWLLWTYVSGTAPWGRLRANQTLRSGGWCWRSPPAGWTCGSGSCSCWGWTAESPRSPHCWPERGAAAASGPQQSTGSRSSCAISSWSPTAPSGRNFTRSFLMYFKLHEKVQNTALTRKILDVWISGKRYYMEILKAATVVL